MTIILFLNKDFEANLTYNLLKEELSKHNVHIYYSDTVGNPDKKPKDLNTLEYYEKHFIFHELKQLLKKHEVETSFEFFGDSFTSVPFKKCTNVNSKAFIDEVTQLQPDVFISVRFGKIFKDDIIKVPKYGLLNLHSAILPDYRGIMGTLHALKNGDLTLGCTLHTIPNSGIDTGEIITVPKLQVNQSKSLFWHIVNLYPLGSQSIIEAINTISEGKELVTMPQNLKEGNYFSVPIQDDFEVLKRKGIVTISKNDYIDILKQFVVKDETALENLEQVFDIEIDYNHKNIQS